CRKNIKIYTDYTSILNEQECVFFFFSSRRRHTRFSRDWSSDVCSSDLGPHHPRLRRRQARRHQHAAGVFPPHPRRPRGGSRQGRSEERRVGKECRTRPATDSEYKNNLNQEAMGLQRGHSPSYRSVLREL